MKRSFVFLFFIFPNLFFAQQPKLVLPIGHTSEIYSAEFSRDGRYVLTASSDNPALVWEAKSGRQLYTISINNALVNLSSFSPDGKFVATVATDSTLSLWETISGKLVWSIKNNKKIINIQFSPDGKFIGVVCRFAPLFLCETSDGKIFKNYFYDSALETIQFAPNGKKVYASYLNGDVVGFNIESVIADIKINAAGSNPSMPYISPDGNFMVTLGTANVTKIWDISSSKQLYEIPTCGKVSFSPDSKYLLTSSYTSNDSTPKVYELSSGKILYNLNGHKHYWTQAVFSPDGKYIATSSFDHTAKLWDASNGKPILTFNEYTGEHNMLAFTSDSRFLLTASASGSANIWEIPACNLFSSLQGHSKITYDCEFNKKGDLFATTAGKEIKIWDLKSGKLLQSLKGHTDYVFSLSFHTDGKHLLSRGGDNTIRSWNLTTGKQINLEKVNQTFFLINNIQLSADGKWIIYVNENNDVVISDFFTGKPIRIFQIGHGYVYSCELSSDKKYLLSASADSIIRVWNVSTGKEVTETFSGHSQSRAWFDAQGKNIIIESITNPKLSVWHFSTNGRKEPLEGHSWFINSVRFSRSGNYFVTSSNDYSAILWDSRTLQVIKKFPHDNYLVHDAFMSPDEKYILSYAADKMTRIWNSSSGEQISKLPGRIIDMDSSSRYLILDNNTIDLYIKTAFEEKFQLLYSAVAIDSIDYFTQIPSGYYQTTTAGAKLLHYVTKDLKIISFEQLDVKYNRPDKVLEAIGNTDTALIKSYRKAYEKRIKKLGIDTTAFRDGYSVPEADFVNRDNIEYEQKNEMLKFHIKGIDSTYELDRFNVWVNEVPVYGQRGISIRKRNRNDFDTTISIKLSQGENRIETSITNVNGTESYRMPIIINYTPAVKQKESTRFIGIGVDKFVDNQYNLQYSVKDIRDLAVKLKEKYRDNIIIDTLFNQNVTVSNVKALKAALLKTNENDKVIIAYSGHGMLSNDNDYYLSTYTVNFEKPEENGLSYDELESLLDSIPARKKLMLIDACHSGEVDKEDLVTLNASSDSLIKGLKPVGYKQEGHLGLKNSFELMQSLFVNVGKSTGATIISAAAGTQFALERNDLRNGVFTFSILEAMKTNATMKISELKTIVGKRVEELTNGLQKPTSRNETIAVDWNLW